MPAHWLGLLLERDTVKGPSKLFVINSYEGNNDTDTTRDVVEVVRASFKVAHKDVIFVDAPRQKDKRSCGAFVWAAYFW